MLAASALLMLWACSGGAGGGGTLTAGGGIGGSGMTVGSVSKFGSVFVNDVEFDTAEAAVVVDGTERGTGDQAVLDNLAAGRLVRVEGPSSADGTGTARRIVYNEDVVGPVDGATAVDADTVRLLVMGQTVVVDRETNLDGVVLGALAVGQLVEVSGFVDEQGFIRAGYLGKRADAYAPGGEVQVRGRAADVDPVLRTFAINQLAIGYAAADVGRLAGGAPQPGQLVEVKGTLNAGGALDAASVAPESIFGVEDADEVEIAGIVTLFNSIADFEVGGVPVRTDGATELQGVLPEDLGPGSRLIARGSLSAGVLLADTLRPGSQVKIESNVAAVSPSSLTLEGLAPLVVATNGLTRFLGAAASIGEIAPGDHVKIFGTSLSAGRATASKIIAYKQPKQAAALRGPVESVAGGFITVLGVAVDTSAAGSIPPDGFSLEGGGRLTRGEFQARVSAGDVVTVQGSLSGGSIAWSSVELKESD